MFFRIPLSLRTRGEIELDEAKREHENYVKLLRDLDIGNAFFGWTKLS
jgi:dimethylargininase